MTGAVTVGDIRMARDRISDVVDQTPLVRAHALDVPDGNALWLKAENLQRTGAFKLRGASNAVAALPPEKRAHGVITYSSGNHGQAVAAAAGLLGIPAVIVMPEDAISVKIEATRRWGAEIVFAGHTSLDREARAVELANERGYTIIPPFDDPDIIAGQGTAGLEILEQLPDVEAVVVPIGGGGLISGIATAVKSQRPDVTVIGVEPEAAADARDSLRAGEIVTWDTVDTIADGLRTSRIGRLNFEAIRTYVDEIVTVTEDEMVRAIELLAVKARLVAEPSGAAAPAAVLFGRTGLSGRRMVAVISGGNVAVSRLAASLEREGSAAAAR